MASPSDVVEALVKILRAAGCPEHSVSQTTSRNAPQSLFPAYHSVASISDTTKIAIELHVDKKDCEAIMKRLEPLLQTSQLLNTVAQDAKAAAALGIALPSHKAPTLQELEEAIKRLTLADPIWHPTPGYDVLEEPDYGPPIVTTTTTPVPVSPTKELDDLDACEECGGTEGDHEEDCNHHGR